MIKKNLWHIIATLIGITGIFLTIFLYQKTIRERDPVLIIDPIRTEILDSGKLANSPIIVVTPEGTAVKADVTSVNFFFWNKGRQPIKKEDILKRLSIVIEDSLARIIDLRLLAISREICQIQMNTANSEPMNRIEINFEILEKYDGFAGQIIYEGNPQAHIIVKGIIEGVESVSNFALSESGLVERAIINVFIGIGITILCIVLFILMMAITPQPDYDPPDIRKSNEYKNNREFQKAFDRYDSIQKELENKRNQEYVASKKKKKGRWKVVLFSVLLSIFIIAFIISYFWTKSDVIDNPRDYIPKTIVTTF